MLCCTNWPEICSYRQRSRHCSTIKSPRCIFLLASTTLQELMMIQDTPAAHVSISIPIVVTPACFLCYVISGASCPTTPWWDSIKTSKNALKWVNVLPMLHIGYNVYCVNNSAPDYWAIFSQGLHLMSSFSYLEGKHGNIAGIFKKKTKHK